MGDLASAGRLVAAVGLVVGLAACSSTAPGSPVPAPTPVAGGLVGAPAGVRAAGVSDELVEYGAVAAVRDLVRADRQRFGSLLGVGYSEVAVHSAAIADAAGFDPSGATEAVRVGRPPDSAVLLRMAVDRAAVDAKFAGLGAERVDTAGATTWITGEDHEVRADGPFGRAGTLGAFNRARVTGDSVAFAPSGAALARVTDPGGPSLAQDEVVGGLAACLGEVTVAIIGAPGDRGFVSAAGVRVARDEVTEVVCVPTADPAALRDRVLDRLDSTGAGVGRWPAEPRGARVEAPADLPGVLRVETSVAPGSRVGLVLQAWGRGDVAALVG